MKNRSASGTSTPVTIIPLLPGGHFFLRMADLHKLIARRAYRLFVAGGRRHGHDVQDWLEAESELLMSVPIKLCESERAVTVKATLTGCNANDVEIHAEPLRLFISGRTQKDPKDRDAKRGSKSIFRSVDLPTQIDPSRARATFGNGELEIALPTVKAERKLAAAMRAAA